MQDRMDETRAARVDPSLVDPSLVDPSLVDPGIGLNEPLAPHPNPTDRSGLPERRGQPVQPEPITNPNLTATDLIDR